MNINDVVQRCFPGNLLADKAFEDWLDPLRADVSPGAVDLLMRLNDKLDEEKKALFLKIPIKRDCWEIFGGSDKLIKSVSSIRSKLCRDLFDKAEEGGSYPLRLSEDELAERVLAFSDFGRIRIVADFPSDIDHLLGPSGNICFRDFILREKGYPDDYRSSASQILKKLSRTAPEPIPQDALEKFCTGTCDFRKLITCLVEDYDLVQSPEGWRMRSSVIADRWRIGEPWLTIGGKS